MLQFEDLQIEESILQAVKEIGFEVPTPVQEKVIPVLMSDEMQDIIGLAQTGTGKTAAFGIPLIQKVNSSSKKIQFLILAPTRELCLQIADDLKTYSKYKPQINIVPVFGGSSIERQIQLIKKGAHIVSATPGRLVDLINRGIVDLSHIKTVVLDEADEMLNMGFRDELETILKETPKEKQTLLFSATMPNEVRAIANKYMKKPEEITVGKKNAGAENVSHVCYLVNVKDRYLALKRIVDHYPDIYGIVFCRTRKETQEVADKLMQDGYNADSLHGDLSQAQRDIVMNRFRVKHLQLLVATDVAARGLDVDNLSHIINYNLPEELDIYTHRSGRTGRAGKTGMSIVICGVKEKGKLQQIEKKIKKSFTFASIPTGKEICEKQLFHLIDRMEKVEVDYSRIDPYLPDIFRKLEWLDREELIKKFVSMEFNRFLEYYKKMPDLNIPLEPRKSGKRKGEVAGFTRFFINLGRTDELRPNSLMGLINEFTGISDIEIGDIELLKNFSFFEADSDFTDTIMNAFKNKEYKGRKIDLEISVSKGKNKERKKEGFFSREKFKGDRKFRGERSNRGRDFREDNYRGENPRKEKSSRGRNGFGDDNQSSYKKFGSDKSGEGKKFFGAKSDKRRKDRGRKRF